MFVLRNWQHYLYGIKCDVFTNHSNLQYVPTLKDLNLSQQRWMELLNDYNVIIQYHFDQANFVVDALSRKVVSMCSLACLSTHNQPLDNEIHTIAFKFIQLGI